MSGKGKGVKEQKKREASQLSSANSACCLAGDAFSVCGGGRPFSLAVRPSETSRMATANGQLKNSQPLNVRRNFFLFVFTSAAAAHAM